MKTCNICGLQKDLGEFYKHPKGVDGRFPACKSCHQKRSYEWKKSNPLSVKVIERRHQLKKKYGISESDRVLAIENQGGRCACCGDEFKNTKSTHTHHDHSTGKFLHVLCHHCNMAEGHLKTSDRAFKLFEYMTKNETL